MALPTRSQANQANQDIQGNQGAQGTEMARWNPFAELERELFRNWGDYFPLVSEGFMPMADVEEMEDAYVVELELPGAKKGDIEISLSGRRLTVTGERKEKERVGIVRRRTRSVGRFHYEILLPGPVDESGVSASLDDDVLTVRVPKAATEKPRRIKVT